MNQDSRPPFPTAPLARRDFLKRSIGGIAGLRLAGLVTGLDALAVRLHAAAPKGSAPQSVPPTTWGINVNIDDWRYYAGTAKEVMEHVGPLLEDTGCSLVREGLQGNLRGNNLDRIDWGNWFDKWAEWLAARGMNVAVQLNLHMVKNPGFAYDRAWEERVRHKCLEAARHINADPRRRQAVAWFMLINEPDLKVGDEPGGFITPERLVRCHQIAWEAIKSVNPDFLIEGLSMGDGAGIGAAAPLRSFNLGQANAGHAKEVPGMKSIDVFNLGITRYCDLVGVHSYNNISDDTPYGLRALNENMLSAHEKFGFPVRPIVNTETGCHVHLLNRAGGEKGGQMPKDAADDAKWRAVAHWQYLNVLQQARFGVARSIFYLLGGSPGANWMSIVDYPMAKSNAKPWSKRPTFASAVASFQPQTAATLNGGFEQPEDKYTNWLVHFDPLNYKSKDLEYGEWKEAHFLTDGRQTAPGATGRGYLRFDAGLQKFARRRVEGLASGRSYTVTAWVRQTGAAKASLAVYGFDQKQPAATVAASTEKTGEWVRLSVEFTPVRCVVGVDCWGVISLEHDGKAACFWDEVAIV